jgi:hypothetical protein
MHRRLTKIVVFILLLVVVQGCGPTRRNNIICLIDYSGTISHQTLDIYAQAIARDVFLNLSRYDKMVLIPIDEGSKIKADKLLFFDLKDSSFEKNLHGFAHREQGIEKRLNDYKNRYVDSVYHEVSRCKEDRLQYTKYTDIASALEQVSYLLETSKAPSMLSNAINSCLGTDQIVSKNIIILFSDMIQESPALNFTRCAFDDTNISKMINRLKTENHLPDFSSCKVFVCGRTAPNNNMIDGINKFWTAYFKETHAQLVAYDYDSRRAIAAALKNNDQ